MAQFEAEIVNSMQKVSSSVDKVAASTATANKNMLAVGDSVNRASKEYRELEIRAREYARTGRDLTVKQIEAERKAAAAFKATGTQIVAVGNNTREAGTHTSSLANNMAKAQAAASRAGGAMGGAVAQVASLAALNPQMLAVGAAVGFIAAQAGALFERIQAVNAALPDTARLAGEAAAAMRASGGKALLGADLGGMVSSAMAPAGPISRASAEASLLGVSRATADANLAAFRRSAPRVRLSPEQELQIAVGRGDMDPADFARGRAQLETDPVFQEARNAQTRARLASEWATTDTLRFAAGQSSSQNDALRRLTDEMEALRQEMARGRINNMLPNAVGITSQTQDRQVRQMEYLQLQLRVLSGQAAESGR
jgi:hypothetical protein